MLPSRDKQDQDCGPGKDKMLEVQFAVDNRQWLAAISNGDSPMAAEKAKKKTEWRFQRHGRFPRPRETRYR
jgi:hypothetical protein